MLDVRLYLLQRLSAMVLAPLVLVHLVMIMVAVQGGLDAAEILDRTRGSVGWAAFYGLFVVAAAVHGAIGLRVVVHEVFKLEGGALRGFTWVAGLVLLAAGLRAVFAVVVG